MAGPAIVIIQVVVSVVVVSIVGVCVFVAHPRMWWMNRSFDVEGYIEDELTPALMAHVVTIVGARAAPVTRRKSAVVAVGNDGIVRVTPGSAEADALSMRGFVESSLPSAGRIRPGDKVDADHVSKYLVDMADEASARNANRGNFVASLVVECWSMNGTPVADYVAAQGLLPVLFSIDRDALSGIRSEIANPELAAQIRTVRVSDRDPAAALLLECVQAESDGEAWTLLRTELDKFLDCVKAISALRTMTTFVFPQIKRMRIDRNPDMDFMQVFKMFNRPYLVQFKVNCTSAFSEFTATTGAILETAKRLTDDLKAKARSNLTGRQENFEPAPVSPGQTGQVRYVYTRDTQFGVKVDDDLTETFIEEFSIGGMFKGIGKAITGTVGAVAGMGGGMGDIFSLLPNLIKVVQEIVDLGIIMIRKLFENFMLLTSNPLMFFIANIMLLINALILVIMIICTPIIVRIIWWWMVVVPLAIKLLFYTLMLSWASVWNLVLSLGDIMTGGQLRHLALSEEHPESWFNNGGAHSGNGTSRIFGTFYPCAEGYSCGFVPTYCGKVSRCEPLRSPIAMLAHDLKYGRPTPLLSTGKAFMHPLVPDDSIACIRLSERYKKQSAAPVTCNSFTLRNDVREDIALASCLGRMKSGDTINMCKVCQAAVVGKHRAMASASNVSADMSAAKVVKGNSTRGSTKTAFCVVAFVVLIAVSTRVSVLREIAAPK